jgi:hypothetical protein
VTDEPSLKIYALPLGHARLASPANRVGPDKRANRSCPVRAARLNYEASIAFAELALEIISLIVIWTSYQKRMSWSWFVMVIFFCVYYVPVRVLDFLLGIRSRGWSWWPAAIRDAMGGRQLAIDAFSELAILTLMVIALLLPVRDFFGKKRSLPSGGQSK